MDLGTIKVHPDCAGWVQEVVQCLQAVAHHGEPDRMLQRIVIRCERLTRVERRVDIDITVAVSR